MFRRLGGSAALIALTSVISGCFGAWFPSTYWRSNWGTIAPPPSATRYDHQWNDVVFGGSTFVAVGSSAWFVDDAAKFQVMTSADGATWTPRAIPTAGSSWRSVAWGNGTFVAVGDAGDGTSGVMTSPDGATWTMRPTPPAECAGCTSWESVAFGGSQFVAVGYSNDAPDLSHPTVMTSPDGATWTVTVDSASYDWTDVTYGAGVFVALRQGDVLSTPIEIVTSPDGNTWTQRTSPADSRWRSLSFGGGQFVAVADWGSRFGESFKSNDKGVGERVMTSPDGITWTLRSSAVDNQWIDVTYGNGRFVAVAVAGTIGPESIDPSEFAYGSADSGGGDRMMSSVDGVTWSLSTLPVTNEWTAVAHGAGTFVAVAQSGLGNRVATSPDGVNWTVRTLATPSTPFLRQLAPEVRVRKSVKIRKVLGTYSYVVPAGWTSRTVVLPKSKNICRVLGDSIRGLRKGSCALRTTITNPTTNAVTNVTAFVSVR